MNIVKKRGRKPKNKIVVNNNPCFDNKDVDIIIKINNNDNNNNNTFIYSDIEKIENTNLEKIENNNLEKIENNNLEKMSNKCLVCQKKCVNNNILPLKYINNIFYVIDNFYSEECIMKYIFENCKYNKYEIYSLYQLYKNLLKLNIDIKYIYIDINKKQSNNNIENITKKNLKLYRGKKNNNIMNFINNI